METPFLEIHTPTGHSQVKLEKPVTIGRHPSNAVVLTDTMSSRQHCVVEKEGDRFRVRDLNSSNGTRLNGQIIRTATLAHGDVITIGKTMIRLVIPGADENGQVNGNGEELETLTAEDVVDDGISGPNLAPMTLGGGQALSADVDFEQALEELAESLPDHAFGEHDIALINSRGQLIHEAGKPKPQGQRREAVDIFRLIMLVCFRSRTTDIHIEPRQDCYQARLRIDGTMVDVARLPTQVGHRLATLVKVLSDIDISQRNAIQEGHFASRVPGGGKTGMAHRRVDYRVSFAPAVYGQKLVIRILDAANAPLRATDLNMPRWMLDELGNAVRADAGMILVAGPTGSGKTTSLYSLVRSIEVNRRNVVTIEDPVEIQLEGVTQIPVNEEEGKSFSALLRSVLRQDPDVILVGEVRDAETARIAMQAAITGHLVFSTIHTKDTVGTIFRLLDLGVEPYLIAQGLHLALAQRLVRQLCRYCKKPMKPTQEQRDAMGPAGEKCEKIFVPVGCMRCLGTGFAGRRAFFELLRTTDELRDVIIRSPNMQDIQAALAKTQFVKLAQSGYDLVAEGAVAFQEIDKAVGR
jgi:type II secretory ATPase GspE/PulE/Tfp pilus assembly ATPase PilB-like protein